jgi:hypothetical protein
MAPGSLGRTSLIYFLSLGSLWPQKGGDIAIISLNVILSLGTKLSPETKLSPLGTKGQFCPRGTKGGQIGTILSPVCPLAGGQICNPVWNDSITSLQQRFANWRLTIDYRELVQIFVRLWVCKRSVERVHNRWNSTTLWAGSGFRAIMSPQMRSVI